MQTLVKVDLVFCHRLSPSGPVCHRSRNHCETHLRGPGKVLRSRLPELVHQEIWAWLPVHHALSALVTTAAEMIDSVKIA